MKPAPVDIPNRPRGLEFKIEALVEPRFQIDAQAGTIDLFDAITPETPTRLAAGLRQLNGKALTLRLSSLGGDPFSALSGFNLLAAYSGDVRVEILSIAASAASVLAMAGDEILIAKGGQVMVHNSTAGVIGGADDLRALAEGLDRVDGAMAAIYQARTGLPLDQVRDLMAREAFMSSDEAVELGFADAVLDRDADPAPRTASATAPKSKRDLEEQFRRLGFSRAEALRMTAAAWPAREGDDPDDVDLDRVQAALERNFQRLEPLLSPRRVQ